MKLGFLHSLIRLDEKFLLDEIRKRNNIELIKLDDRKLVFDLHKNSFDYDVVLERCINHSRALTTLQILNSNGIITVNDSKVADTCGSKFLTSLALIKNKVKTPKVMMAYTPESALEAIEKMGYPCVIKPAVGSWGRLIAKVTSRESAEAILEHKNRLGSYHHSIFYLLIL